MLIDTHCHLEADLYDNLDALIADLPSKDVKQIIINGYNVKANREAISLADKHDNVYAAVGYAPSEVDNIVEADLELLEEQLQHPKVIAIGEIGLDYYWKTDNKEQQQKIFMQQLDLANKYQKPVIVHNREATEDVYNLLKEKKVRGIIHCFNGSLDQAQQFINLGFLLGINGIITYKKNDILREVISSIPLEHIVLETDSPYLIPEPFRGKQNSPLYLSYVATTLSEIKHTEYNIIGETTTKNVKCLFDLK